MTETKLDELIQLQVKINEAKALVDYMKKPESIADIEFYGGKELADEFLKKAEVRARKALEEMVRRFNEA